MSDRGQAPSRHSDGRSSGPQGTRFFSTEALRQYISDAANGAGGRISVHEPVLEGSSPGIEGRRFILHPGRQAIGRRTDNEIVIDDLSVSGNHAWITNQRGRCMIVNTLSTNGTFVNDRRIHEVVLRHGDHIRLGQAEFVFLTREHGQPEPASRRRIVVVVLLAAVGALAVLAWWFFGSP